MRAHTKIRKKAPSIRLSLVRAADEFDVSRGYIRARLRDRGILEQVDYSIKDIYTALAENPKLSSARLNTAKAVEQERLNAIAEGQLFTLEENEKWQDQVLAPIRSALLSLPSTEAARCNPGDPDFAFTALDEWVKRTLPILRKEISKAKKIKMEEKENEERNSGSEV